MREKTPSGGNGDDDGNDEDGDEDANLNYTSLQVPWCVYCHVAAQAAVDI